MNNIIFIGLFFLACLGIKTSPNEKAYTTSKKINTITETFYGDWKIYKFYCPSLISSEENYMTKEKAKTYLNKTVSFQKYQAVIFDVECNTVNYHQSKENAFEYFYYNYRMVADTITGKGTRGLHKEDLGINSNSIYLIEVSCNKLYYDLIILDSKELILVYKSVFFFLKKLEE